MSDLTDLGLSSYEERAYRSLLVLGPATAGQVADASGVPEGRIYDVLNGLAGRDLVSVRTASDPREYEAVDPDAAVDRLLAERREELRAERERYERLADQVGDELATTTSVESRFWPIELGSEDASAAMREQFDAADESLLSVVGSPYADAPVEHYESEIATYADLVCGDLEVKLLATPGVFDSSLTDRLAEALATAPDFAVRTAPGIDFTYDVLDGDVVYASLPAPFEAGERLGGVVIRDGAVAETLTEGFRQAWARADPVESEASTRD